MATTVDRLIAEDLSAGPPHCNIYLMDSSHSVLHKYTFLNSVKCPVGYWTDGLNKNIYISLLALYLV